MILDYHGFNGQLCPEDFQKGPRNFGFFFGGAYGREGGGSAAALSIVFLLSGSLKPRIKDQGSDQGSRIKDKDEGSRITDLVQPWMSILKEIRRDIKTVESSNRALQF